MADRLDLRWVDALKRESANFEAFIATLDEFIRIEQNREPSSWEETLKGRGEVKAYKRIKQLAEMDQREQQHADQYRRDSGARSIR